MLFRVLRVGLRAPAALLVTILLMATYILSPRSALRWRRRVQRVWCRALLRLFGLRLLVEGEPNRAGVTLFCSNHVSYLDILVLSSEIDGVFIAKSDVAGWPLFGQIAAMTGTIMVDRTPSRARAQREEIRARLANGCNLILFPEGTSTNGDRVVPFKSSLFDIASPGDAELDAWTQPASIAYVSDRDGEPLTGPRRDLYTWHGDMTLAPHLLNVMSMPGADVRLILHDPCRAADFRNRKDLARHNHALVASGVSAAFAENRLSA